MSVGTVEARQEPLAKQNRAWGSGEPEADKPRLLAHRARQARVLKGGLEFSAERSSQSGRTRWLRCMPDASRQLHALGAKGCLTGANDFLLEKSWRQANHRGSSRHLATADTARWRLHVG